LEPASSAHPLLRRCPMMSVREPRRLASPAPVCPYCHSRRDCAPLHIHEGRRIRTLTPLPRDIQHQLTSAKLTELELMGVMHREIAHRPAPLRSHRRRGISPMPQGMHHHLASANRTQRDPVDATVKSEAANRMAPNEATFSAVSPHCRKASTAASQAPSPPDLALFAAFLTSLAFSLSRHVGRGPERPELTKHFLAVSGVERSLHLVQA
jgi:hypothetical protein